MNADDINATITALGTIFAALGGIVDDLLSFAIPIAFGVALIGLFGAVFKILPSLMGKLKI